MRKLSREEKSKEKVALAEGEIKDFDKGDTMKVASNGYAKYCKHSIGIKYIAQDGAYKNHLVYCTDLNKNTTSGTENLVLYPVTLIR